MQTISLQEVKNACIQAYLAGNLIAQHKDKPIGYIANGYRCAIGAAMNDETIAAIKQRGLRDGAYTERICKFKNMPEIRKIQKAHDKWYESQLPEDETIFKCLIGLEN